MHAQNHFSNYDHTWLDGCIYLSTCITLIATYSIICMITVGASYQLDRLRYLVAFHMNSAVALA